MDVLDKGMIYDPAGGSGMVRDFTTLLKMVSDLNLRIVMSVIFHLILFGPLLTVDN